jgi:hypothetical protein
MGCYAKETGFQDREKGQSFDVPLHHVLRKSEFGKLGSPPPPTQSQNCPVIKRPKIDKFFYLSLDHLSYPYFFFYRILIIMSVLAAQNFDGI